MEAGLISRHFVDGAWMNRMAISFPCSKRTGAAQWEGWAGRKKGSVVQNCVGKWVRLARAQISTKAFSLDHVI
jgi:hypothetical protein